MNSQKGRKSKGFGKGKSINTRKFIPRTAESASDRRGSNYNSSKQIAEITSICQNVALVTAVNKQQPQALEKFVKLVNQNNLEQLTAYFARYGIDAEFVIQNLDSLIEEEFNNLST